MHVDKEKPVDTAKDIVEQGRKLYFYRQFDNSATYASLPSETFKYEKLYAKESNENGYSFLFPESGYGPLYIQDLMIKEGIVIYSGGAHHDKLHWVKDRQIYGSLPFRLSKYPSRMFPSHAGIVITKKSALKAIFEPIIMRLIEADIIEHYSRSSYYYLWPEKEELPRTPLNLQHMMIGYVIYFIGLLTSVLSFLMELVKNRKTSLSYTR